MDAVIKIQIPQPLMPLLLSNDPPSDSELVQLAALLSNVEAELREFATRSTVELDRLLRYDPLKHLLSSLKGAISPIRRLPREVISEIFLESLPTFMGRSWNSVVSGKSPWALAKVCKSWHEIVLNDPRLWSSIDLDVPSWKTPRCRDLTLAGLMVSIYRSRNNLLAIWSWKCCDELLLRPLLPHSNRWKFLGLCIDYNSIKYLKQIKGKLPELRELSIQPSSRLSNEMDAMLNTPFDPFEDAPKLQQATILFFHMSGTVPWIDPTLFRFPWHQLTSLKTDVIGLLNDCHRLVDCELFTKRYYDQAVGHAITNTSLRNLTLNYTEGIDVLMLPSLESLCLVKTLFVNCASIHSLISRSCRTLRTLHLNEVRMTHEFLNQLLQDCVHLLTVVVYQWNTRTMFESATSLSGWQRTAEGRGGWATYKRNLDDKI